MTPGYLSGASWMLKMTWMFQHVPTTGAIPGTWIWCCETWPTSFPLADWNVDLAIFSYRIIPVVSLSFVTKKNLTLSAWNIAVHIKFISVLLQVDCEVGTYIYNNIQQHTTAIWKPNLRQFVVACHISAIICTSLGGWGCPIPGDAQTLAGRKYM